MRARCPVSACVVVPAETAMAIPGVHQLGRRSGDRLLLAAALHGLRSEARLGRRRLGDGERTAVDLLEEALAVQGHQVTPHGHVGDAEQLDQVGDAHRPVAAELGEDPPSPLGHEHQASRAAERTASRTTATPPARDDGGPR